MYLALSVDANLGLFLCSLLVCVLEVHFQEFSIHFKGFPDWKSMYGECASTTSRIYFLGRFLIDQQDSQCRLSEALFPLSGTVGFGLEWSRTSRQFSWTATAHEG